MTEASRKMSSDERRANELYWGSERSVNQIAEDLGLSKSALYGMIRSLPTALGCPLCGAPAAFPNRTARHRDELVCPVCAWEGTRAEAVAGGDRDAPPSASVRRRLAPPDTARGRIAAGGALLGAAAGLAIVFWVRRR